MNNQVKTMRDAFIEKIYKRMLNDHSIFFLSADMGAPALDQLKSVFKDRFINVGVAEQNLVNIATGLALEGYKVFAYGICAFMTMRAYEQIRQNLAIASQIKHINVNLIGVGAGLSYGFSGPSHHCLEDLSIMRLLPNLTIFSPSDWKLTEKFVDYSLLIKTPKYLRFDSEPLPLIYGRIQDLNLSKGFYELVKGKKICLISSGFMTHRVLKIAKNIKNIGVIDVFLLKPLDENSLSLTLKKYDSIITIEEGFIDKGGLDSLIFKILRDHQMNIKVKNLGFKDKYVFNNGDREYLHKLNGLDEKGIKKLIQCL